jgi:Protein kinase domain/Cyclic nucleotide-binding domain
MPSDSDKMSRLSHEALARDQSERAAPPAAEAPTTCGGEEVPSFHDRGDLRPETAIHEFFSKSGSPLGSLGSDTVRSLLDAMEVCEYGPGEYLIRQGGPADYLLLILSGTAWAQVRGAPVDRAPVGQFWPGDVVGEISLITDEPRTADVIARSSVRALRLSAHAFHVLANDFPELRVLLTNVLTERLGHARYDGLGGKDIHGYRIIQCVGHGGMGVVYEAKRIATGETVALKMMNHRLVYQVGALQRFRREAGTLKTLNHPSIARLYDYFPAYKTEFLAMEFCEGSTLSEIIASRGPLDERVVRNLLGHLAVALKYIHDAGVVHRDLKPSNIMVAKSGSIKLLDFGLVKLDTATAHSIAVESEHASASMLLGTARYMAPEQFSGRAADRRSDFYALACIAYEALTGQPVIQASNVFEVVREQLRFALPPQEQIGPGVSGEMYDLLSRGLDASPDNRTLDLVQLAAWAASIDLGIR